MTTMSPCACANPAASAAAFPKLRRSRTTRTLSLRVVQAGQRGERAVGRAVVDEDRLPGLVERLEGRVELVEEERDRPLLVVNGDDDRDHGAREPIRQRVAYAAVLAELLTIEEAQRLILERVRPLGAEPVPLEEAGGRILAETARAAVDLPPFPSSAMDGFALRVGGHSGPLPVVERIAAGVPASRDLRAGEAMAIATGGVVPEGADAVIPIEYVVET